MQQGHTSVRQWLAAMDDATLATVALEVSDELRAREVAGKKQACASRAPDAIDERLRELKAGWAADAAAEAAEIAARNAATRAARLELRRTKLLSGEWKPEHNCMDCLQAIARMDPDLRCAQAIAGRVAPDGPDME